MVSYEKMNFYMKLKILGAEIPGIGAEIPGIGAEIPGHQFLRLTCLHFVRTAKFHMKTWLHLHFFRTTMFHMKIWLYLHFFRMAKFHMKTWLQLHFFRTTKFHMKTWLHYMLKGSNCFGVFHTWSFHPVCGRRLLWIQGPA